MKIDILSLFPEFINVFTNWSMISRAVDKEKVEIGNVDIRDFSKDKHNKVDDYPFGGGPGMVMTPGPIFRAIDSVKTEGSKVIYLSPQGEVYSQDKAKELAKEEHLILLCGHYEGIDNRIIEEYVDEEISIGDYVLTGGEIPAMVLVDSIIRLLPGVLGSKESYEDESHYNGILEHPQWTRPREFKGKEVPEILLSGHHKNIEEWRKYKSLEKTLLNRPDLLKNVDQKDRLILDQIKKDLKNK